MMETKIKESDGNEVKMLSEQREEAPGIQDAKNG